MNFLVPSQSVCLFVCLFVCMFVCLYVCLFVFFCLFLFVLLLQAVVVVDREFPTLSGEILDFLQSLPGMHFVRFAMNIPLLTKVHVSSGLKSCVFSFGTDGSLNPLYLEAVEERSAINSMLHPCSYTLLLHVQQKLVNTDAIDNLNNPNLEYES